MRSAHQRAQVASPFHAGEQGVQVAGVLAGVDDAQGLWLPPQTRRQIRIVQNTHPPDSRAPHRRVREQAGRIRGQLPDSLETVVEPVRLGQCRLRGGHEHNARSPAAREVIEHRNTRAQVSQRDCLRLVQNHDAVGDVVQLAAFRRAVCEQALEELNRRCDDDRHVPVFGCQAELGPRFARAERLLVESAVMFKDEIAVVPVSCERRTEHRGILLDDAGVGNDVDHPPQSVPQHMLQGESKRGQCLAAPGRHGQREQPRWLAGLLPNVSKNQRAHGVNPRVFCGLHKGL